MATKQERFYFSGEHSKPLIIFIHGMGMDAGMWADPQAERVLGGKYPLSVLLKGMELRSPFHDLREKGYPVLAWSQKRPAGPIAIAVEELQQIVAEFSTHKGGVVLVGHSRGGLIARLFMQEYDYPVSGVVTIGTPHRGSSMAKWAVNLSPVTAALSKLMDMRDKEVKTAMHRIMAFLSSDELKELLPGSKLLQSLSEGRRQGISILSIGGTDPSLFRLGNASLPAFLASVLPEKMLPDELRDGLGDGFVSASSAVYPAGDEHMNSHAHHAGLVFHREVRDCILRAISMF